MWVVALVVIVLLILLYLFLRPHKEAFQKNTRAKTRRLLQLGILFALGLCTAGVVLHFRKAGDGALFTDQNTRAEEELSAESENGAYLTVTVGVDTVWVGARSYPVGTELKEAMTDAVNSGKNIRLVDDYASAETYRGVLALLAEAGINAERIEETREP